LLGRDDIGLITPGRRADLVLLDADPCTVPVSDLPRIAVTETWIDGELAWKAGAPAH
jgi:predicted amidohydrolase YtcJ